MFPAAVSASPTTYWFPLLKSFFIELVTSVRISLISSRSTDRARYPIRFPAKFWDCFGGVSYVWLCVCVWGRGLNVRKWASRSPSVRNDSDILTYEWKEALLRFCASTVYLLLMFVLLFFILEIFGDGEKTWYRLLNANPRKKNDKKLNESPFHI